jgi:site-specific DNA-methyltransferase (adenine-specific)
MIPEFDSKVTPDILEVISDLSNFEVYTPPRVAKELLDLLPPEVWTNPNYRWLDPGCKTGIFLREAAKRLMVGLESHLPDEKDRLNHILQNMLFGISITGLTAMLSRRTLYCSKDATSEMSIVKMSQPNGHIWFENLDHNYLRGYCLDCKNQESGLVSEDFHAYGFIHEKTFKKISGEFDMKFDVIVGNPPYQMESENNNRNMPLYNLFVEQAKELNPKYIAMIIPSRWYAGGLGLGEFRSQMLSDKRIRIMVDFPVASEVFPGPEIKGGVCYFLWDRDNKGDCDVTLVRGDNRHGPVSRDLSEFEVFVRDSRGLEILNNVLKKNEASITEILSADKEFGMTSNFSGYKEKKSTGDIPIFLNKSGKRIQAWIQRKDINKSESLIDTWKVFSPKAGSDGGQKLPDAVLGTPFIGPSPSVCTQTYLFFHCNSEEEAKSIESYIKTRFVRFLISLRKNTQDATPATYTWVPKQKWTKQWSDEDLFKKYEITQDEQQYIFEMVKESI